MGAFGREEKSFRVAPAAAFTGTAHGCTAEGRTRQRRAVGSRKRARCLALTITNGNEWRLAGKINGDGFLARRRTSMCTSEQSGAIKRAPPPNGYKWRQRCPRLKPSQLLLPASPFSSLFPFWFFLRREPAKTRSRPEASEATASAVRCQIALAPRRATLSSRTRRHADCRLPWALVLPFLTPVSCTLFPHPSFSLLLLLLAIPPSSRLETR